MIGHKNKYIYIHINKCAGTTIQYVLKNNYGGEFLYTSEDVEHTRHKGHVTASQYSTCSHWKEYFKFSFVRNPWDKELSDYKYYKKMKSTYLHFEEYLNRRTNLSKIKYWNSNQLDWLRSSNGIIELDYIGRFENLQHDFNVVCDRIGISRIDLPVKNKTVHEHYSEYYTGKCKDIVAERYAEDIKYFGYEFGQ